MPLTRIKSLGITDGTIVNDDISSSAAIAQSKITGSFGKVLQVLQYTLSGQVITTSGSPVTTGLTGSITPSSSSNKILILVSMTCCYQTTGNVVGNTTIYRGATNLGAGSPASFGDTYSVANGITTGQSYQYLDSPNTTSSTTYTIYFFNNGSGSFRVNQNGNTSYMNLIEISG